MSSPWGLGAPQHLTSCPLRRMGSVCLSTSPRASGGQVPAAWPRRPESKCEPHATLGDFHTPREKEEQLLFVADTLTGLCESWVLKSPCEQEGPAQDGPRHQEGPRASTMCPALRVPCPDSGPPLPGVVPWMTLSRRRMSASGSHLQAAAQCRTFARPRRPQVCAL